VAAPAAGTSFIGPGSGSQCPAAGWGKMPVDTGGYMEGDYCLRPFWMILVDGPLSTVTEPKRFSNSRAHGRHRAVAPSPTARRSSHNGRWAISHDRGCSAERPAPTSFSSHSSCLVADLGEAGGF